MKTIVWALVACFAFGASGATWTNGSWSVAANWTEGVVPEAGAAVTINNATASATFNVDVDSVSISSLTFASGGKQCYVVGGILNISAESAVVANHSMTISNSLVLSHSAPKLQAATSGRSYYCGDVTLTHATGDLYSYGKGGSTFYGTVTVPRDFRPGKGAAWQSRSNHYIYGPLKCRHVMNVSSYDDTTYTYYSTSNSWTYFETGSYVRNVVATAGALPRTAVLRAYGSDHYDGGTCNLNGTDQTIDRLSGTTKKLTVNGGSTAMTLTMCATASDTSKAVLNGSLSLVYSPTNSSYVQTINGGACSMNGSLTVSNGTFRVAGASSLANVKRIVVADGATFDLATEAANALAGVTNIVLGAGAHFAIAASATTPFTASAVTLEADSTATFDLPEGANYLFASVVVDGVPLDGDTYTGGVAPFSGTGEITVPDVERPTVEATWNGNGEDDGIATDGNWAGGTAPALNAGSLLPLFASGGSQALVDRALDFKGLHFGGEAASFSLVSNSPSASLTLRQSGITVDASHTATVDVPVKVKSDQTWTIGTGSTLRLKSPADMTTAYAVAVAGSGATSGSGAAEQLTSALKLDAENGFLGDINISGTLVNVFSSTNAFGPAGDVPVTLKNSMLRLNGGTVERPVALSGQNNKYGWFHVQAGTNVFTKLLSQDDVYWRPRLSQGSVLVTEGGVSAHCDVLSYGGGEWIIRNKPFVLRNVDSTVSALQLTGNETVRFETGGNVVKRLKLEGGCKVHCGVDNPFSGSSWLFMSNRQAVLDLHGHEVSFSRVESFSGGTVTSETPGVLKFTAQELTTTNRAVRFTGAAGIEMCSTGAIVITNAMESAGSVSVTKGRLEFAGDGSWANSTNVNVSGTGRLVLAKRKTFSRQAELTVADDGVLEIPAGIVVNVKTLRIGGKTFAAGTFGGAESSAENKAYAANFAGAGMVQVGTGFTMILR